MNNIQKKNKVTKIIKNMSDFHKYDNFFISFLD